MPKPFFLTLLAGAFTSSFLFASEALLEQHCYDCHNDKKSRGKFKIAYLGTEPTDENLDYWLDCLDFVQAEEMPPEEDSELSMEDRETLIAYFDQKVRSFNDQSKASKSVEPRRLNNREFRNSIRDILLIEDVGTHQPTGNLIGDTLHHGFDTHGETLGFSRFHLEQYVEAVRKIVDATILSEKPEPSKYLINPEGIVRGDGALNTGVKTHRGNSEFYDIHVKEVPSYFEDFHVAPETGFYKIKIRCTGKDRFVYDTKYTGFYPDDPIQLSVHLGDRVQTFDLPDEEETVIELTEWIAAGTRLEFFNPTDAFAMRGNGNFKFQYTIVDKHLEENDPSRYREMLREIEDGNQKHRTRTKREAYFNHWQGARPRFFGAEIEGPFFETWPPKRQTLLLGSNPTFEKTAEILKPIAERAWRRYVDEEEFASIVKLVRSKEGELDVVSALREGVIAILVSPDFLLLNTGNNEQADRFATKFSYFLTSSLPSEALSRTVRGGYLDSYEAVRAGLQAELKQSNCDEFLHAFPYGWLKLGDINFMEPDPLAYRYYHRKKVGEDFAAEALHFFRHMVENNLPIPEFLSADYSFINADLAEVYEVGGIPQDSKLRKHVFKDGRRGGLLGMGAFLTATADSLSTSPIHRAVYVMENFMGIHPAPPPSDIEIIEPDVRQAKTIKEILAAHTSSETCANCHKSIDPWGYAFENFDSIGAWRDVYTVPDLTEVDEGEARAKTKKKNKNKDEKTVRIDSSAKFRNGIAYEDIRGYRKQLLTTANRDRFVRCFITKLLTYANGVEPTSSDFVEVDKILARSAQNDYRIVDTIAAVIDSPLFRE